MDVFTLFGRIAVDASQANEAIDGVAGHAEKSHGAISKAFKKIGKAVLTYFTVSKIVDFGNQLVTLSASAEDAAAKVNTLLSPGTDTTKFFNDMLSASSKAGIAIVDFSEAVYSSMSASIDQADAISFTTNAVKLAKAGFTGTATAVDVLTTAINAYGMSADDATHISDVLITTQNLGKTTVDELASSMGKVIPLASAYGVNLENLAAGYAVLTKGGIATAEATTYQKSMLTELASEGSNVAKVLKTQTGQSFTDLMKSGKSLGDVLQIIYETTGNDTTAFANLWSSTEAGTGALALVNAGAEEFNATLENMYESANATETAYKKVTGTFNEQVKRLQTNLQNVGIQIANKFLPSLTNIVSSIADNVEPAFQKVSDTIGAFGAYLTDKFAGVITDTGINFTALGEGIGKIASDIANKVSTMFTNLIGNMPNILADVGNSISNGWSNVVWPIIQGFFKAAFGVELPDWSSVASSISSGWSGSVWPFIQDLFFAMFGINLPDWSTITSSIKGGWESGVWPLIQDFFKSNFNVEVPGWQNVKSSIESVWTKVKNGIKGYFSTVFTVFTPDEDGTSVAAELAVWWGKVLGALGNLISTIFYVETDESTSVADRLKLWWGKVLEALGSFISSVFAVFTPDEDGTSVAQELMTWWDKVLTVLGNTICSVFGIELPDPTSAINSIKIWWNEKVKPKLGLSASFTITNNTVTKTAETLVEDPVGTIEKAQQGGKVLQNWLRQQVGWNAEGAIFNKATIFDTRLGLQGVGEAGEEAVAPIIKLRSYVREEVEAVNNENAKQMQGMREDFRQFMDELPSLLTNSLASMKFDVNNREFARMVKAVT